MDRVFVYGTLRQGQYNHPILGKARFVQMDELPDHALYSLRYFPAAYHSPGYSVVGEVYEVDVATLERLDRLEGYTGNPLTSLYVRKEKVLRSGLNAYVYLWPRLPDKDMPLIPSGDWTKAI